MMEYTSHVEDCSGLLPVDSRRAGTDFCLMAVSLSGLGQHLDAYAHEILSASEQQKYNQLTFLKRQREWLGGRLACKCATARLMGQSSDLKTVTVNNTEHGRPWVTGEGCEQVHVAISHSDDVAMGLASFVPCGLDVQGVVGALGRVQTRFIRAAEEKVLGAFEGTTLEQLGLCWAIKEALRKQIDLWPLLGFLEARLERVERCGGGYIVRCSTVKKERPLPGPLPEVYATLYKEKALAFCFDV